MGGDRGRRGGADGASSHDGADWDGEPTRRGVLLAGGAAGAALVSGRSASQRAVDLTVEDLEVTQAIQYLDNPTAPDNSLPLVRGKRTVVRAYVGVSGATGPVSGVDGRLRVFVEGFELGGSPFASENGPITAPPSPDREETDHTLNFQFLVPETGFRSDAVSVDFVAEVDHDGAVPETDTGNNATALTNVTFECNRSPTIAYVPINYTFEGEDPDETGLPDASLIRPGTGDSFVGGAFPIPKSPNYFGASTVDWDENVDTTSVSLLAHLETLRALWIPRPDLVYGWLPGNPFWGNGVASGTGEAAFGNTEPARYQRTFAHEVGHLLDLDHPVATDRIGPEVGFHGGGPSPGIAIDDCDPTGDQRTKCRRLLDVMDPGHLTGEAWIDARSYSDLADHDLVADADCPAVPFPGLPEREYYFVTGTIARRDDLGTHSLNPVYRLEGPTELTRPDQGGARRIELRDDEGNVLFGLGFAVSFFVADADEPVDEASFALALPADDDPDVASVVLLSEGEEVARIDRSPNPPEVAIRSPEQGTALAEQTTVRWAARDEDDDPLVFSVQYSPDDGGSFVPLVVNTTDTEFALDTSEIPGSRAGTALIRVLATDGLDTTVAEVTDLTVPDRKPPTVRITEPKAPERTLEVRRGQPLVLSGHGYDPEDGFLTGQQLVWGSNRDGHLGTGRTLQVTVLSPGRHVVSLVGFDGDQNRAEDSVTVIVGGVE